MTISTLLVSLKKKEDRPEKTAVGGIKQLGKTSEVGGIKQLLKISIFAFLICQDKNQIFLLYLFN
ncbi:MAG: hypothetical protein F6K40_20445 [Okeania sp. SIO3I5]|uniref:hypothetical protein n=1 Tax=Okeania sp. SIO3I5 TaxID=2607805 RepID=UPI0013BD718E|nr:hypothetical protein [Okeania sp. SIO3I5]NEQ38508.1 hypothetical protein [Okeania sp. SIO3I5]